MTSNATLTSLWIDDGQGSPMKIVQTTPSKVSSNGGGELKDDLIRFYKDSGLEPVAKEAGIIDANGDLSGFKDNVQRNNVQMIAIPISQSPGRSPHILPRTLTGTPQQPISPMILGTPHRIVSPAQVAYSPRTQLIATPVHHVRTGVDSPQSWSSGVRKRGHDFIDSDFSDRRKKSEKGGKGLRHFSMKVCEKVQDKGSTSYNEVADELVAEFSDPRNMSPTKKKKVPTATLR